MAMKMERFWSTMRLYCMCFVFFCKMIFGKAIFLDIYCKGLSLSYLVKFDSIVIVFFLVTVVAIQSFFSGSDIVIVYVPRFISDVFWD